MKSSAGHFFEDFTLGRVFTHAGPLMVSSGDVSLYRALGGGRHALFTSDQFADIATGYAATIDPLLVFHVVFGQTVEDISLNAVANLGYAEGQFSRPVRKGDTLRAVSEVIGHKENSSGKTGIVYVRTTGLNQRDEEVLSYVRWVMVKKRDEGGLAPEPTLPALRAVVDMGKTGMFARTYKGWNNQLAGSQYRFEDYEIGEKIDHLNGVTVEEAEHQIATRLYQNTAKVHFNAHDQAASRFGRRLIYGGVVISIARGLSINGLGNAGEILAINAGTHAGPLFAGETVYAWSQVLDKAELSETAGALRLRLVAVKDRSCEDFPLRGDDGYWAAIPRVSV